MKKLSLALLPAVALAAFALNARAADHGHLNVGAVGTSQGDALKFDNEELFTTDSGYVYTLDFTNAGRYAGYYQGNITLTVLAATAGHGGPAPNAPALGSQIFAQLVSVDGPSGGAFSFWETGATNPTITLPSGNTGTNLYQISENDGSPGSDPYGHFHGRRFTATRPGLYTMAFRVLDRSTNGVGGGPIHSPSTILKIYFQAGVTIKSLQKAGNSTTVTFGARINRNYLLQSSIAPFNPNSWSDISDAITGNDYLADLVDTNATGLLRFYRVKDVTPP